MKKKDVKNCQRCGKGFTEQDKVYRRHDMFMCLDCVGKEKNFKIKRERLRSGIRFALWGKS